MRLRTAVGILVGIVCMGLAFWGVPLGQFLSSFRRLDVSYLLPIAILFAFQDGLRALRQLLLLRPVAPGMTFVSSVSIFFVSFFCIHLFPARLGEFVRPFLLLRQEKVPLGAGFGMVFAERAMDMLATVSMLLLVLIFVDVPGVFEVAGVRLTLSFLMHTIGWILGALSVGGILVFALWPASLLGALRWGIDAFRKVCPYARLIWLAEHFHRFMISFVRGFDGFRNPRRLVILAILTIIAWASAAAMYALMAQAFGLGHKLGYLESMGVMVVTMLGSLLPAPPAMAGVQEAFGRGAVAVFGVWGPELGASGVAFAVTIHWGQVLLQGTLASFFLTRLDLNWSSLMGHFAEAQSMSDQMVQEAAPNRNYSEKM